MNSTIIIERLVRKNRMEEAFDSMFRTHEIISNNKAYDDLILLQSRYERCSYNFKRGTITGEDAETNFNKITCSILCLLDEFLDGNSKLEPMITKENGIEILLNESLHNFNFSKKEEFLKELSSELKIDRNKLNISAVEKRDNRLAIKIQSLNVTPLLDILNSNTPDIKNLKSKLNIVSSKKVKEIAIWGLKKSVYYLVWIIIFGIILVVFLIFYIGRFIIGYL